MQDLPRISFPQPFPQFAIFAPRLFVSALGLPLLWFFLTKEHLLVLILGRRFGGSNSFLAHHFRFKRDKGQT